MLTRSSIFFVLLGHLSAYAFVGAQNQTAPIVDLGYAQYQGSYNATGNTTNFLGIRYVAPPIGALRFQAPQPPVNESALGVQMADTQPAGCPQGGEGVAAVSPFQSNSNTNRFIRRDISLSEDCLFLNVFVSGTFNSTANLPVLVWIHGGGYAVGYTYTESGDDLIPEVGGGIVVVNIQYRLGVYGFLPGSEVKKNGALNAGLLDQQASLQWVQEHIHKFGGDPERVTIWGESAGAGSVLQHMVAHAGNTQPPLFKQAITSSTYLPSQYDYDDDIAEQLYSDVVSQSGCDNTTDTFQCLVNVDETILEAANALLSNDAFYGTFIFVPVVDGDFIVESPTATILKGKLNGDRYLAMTNTYEGYTFVNSTLVENVTLAEYITQLIPNFNYAQVQAAVGQYTTIGLDTVFDQAVAVMGESIIICPTYALLENFQGHKFKGEFALPPGTHGLDVMYYFPSGGHLGEFINSTEWIASFVGSFGGFAKYGDPNVHPIPDIITPEWSTYDYSNTEMLFNETEDSQADIRAIQTDSALIGRCAFWQSVASSFPQ